MRRISSLPPVAHLILLVVLMTALSQAAAGIPPGPEPSLESKVDALFSKWNTLDSPGAAVAIVKDGLVIYRKGFGCAQLEYGVPIMPSTVFHVASVSKQFTAMAITMLEEQGKLSADDDIRKYLTELADFGKTITIRHLLNHTSGLRDQWDLLVLSGWRMDDVITQAHIMDRLRRQKELNFPPGEQYMYSNSGFTLLAEIVSRVSGRPFTEWTRENIFLPLGMTSTHFHLDHKEIVRNRAYSYEGDAVKGFKQSVLNYANVGATSLFTTVEDMASWLRNFDEKRVGGAAVLDRMLTKGVLNNGTEIPYARGIEVAEYKGLKTIGHSGGDAGFRSHVLYFPEEKFGVAVFSNLASFDPGAMSRQIADIYLASQLKQPEPAPPAAKAPPAKPALKPVILPVKSLEAFVGTYWIEATQLLRKIVVDKDKLIYVRSDDNKTELVPVSPTSFKMKDIPNNVYVTFSDKTANHFDTYTVTGENEPTAVGKRIEPFLPTEEALKEYAGRYDSDELDTRYDLVVKSGALHVQIGHNEGIPVLPLKKDVFSAGGLANIRFQRDGSGAIIGFTISTGRVKNLKFAKMSS
jgi:CubicO group peptidase (beta-lactamase class C family)